MRLVDILKCAGFCTALLCSHSTYSHYSDELVMGVFEFPPLMIAPDNGSTVFYGADIEIAGRLAIMLGRKLRLVNCGSAKRCNALAEEGKIDLISGLIKSKRRETYLSFLDQPYIANSTRAFVVRKENMNNITSYQDLYELDKVGVVRGTLHFPRFDEDDSIKKYEITAFRQGLDMVRAGHLDALAAPANIVDYFIVTENMADLSKADYRVFWHEEVYMAISRKSCVHAELDKVNFAFTTNYHLGEFDKIIRHYLNRYDSDRVFNRQKELN